MPEKVGDLKICSKCGKSLNISEFYHRLDSSDHLSSACKECESLRRKKNPPKICQSKLDYVIKNGKKCRECLKHLNIENFCGNKRSLDGYSDYCELPTNEFVGFLLR